MITGNRNRFSHLHGSRYQRAVPMSQVPRPGGNLTQKPSLLGEPSPMLRPFPQQPPQYPVTIPPPNWHVPPPVIRSIPPPLLPGQSLPLMPQMLPGPLLQPPGVPSVSTPAISEPQSSIPVVSSLTRESESHPDKETSQGNPIPTLLNQGNRGESDAVMQPDVKSRRETTFDNRDRNSPRLSVRVNR